MINALYVETDGVYFDVPGVIPWDIEKDAKQCRNGYPAICHPPCKRWGRYWGGGPVAKRKFYLGDDDQAFAFCLWYVRTFGGVIEHPEASKAFKYYGILTPPRAGGWRPADDHGGQVCCVEQGHYGHPARKATWLYAHGIGLPELKWGPAPSSQRLDEGFHTAEEARAARSAPDWVPRKRLSAKQNLATPIPFRDLLIDMVLNAKS